MLSIIESSLDSRSWRITNLPGPPDGPASHIDLDIRVVIDGLPLASRTRPFDAIVVPLLKAAPALLNAANAVVDSYDGTGCDSSGVVGAEEFQALHEVVAPFRRLLSTADTAESVPCLDMTFAMREGWAIFDVDSTGYLEVEALDDPAEDVPSHMRWKTDEDALRYVENMASQGSAYHVEALRICKESQEGQERPRA